MSDPRSRGEKKREAVRVVRHERVISSEPALLSPEEEDFNRFLEEEAERDEEKKREKPKH